MYKTENPFIYLLLKGYVIHPDLFIYFVGIIKYKKKIEGTSDT